MDYSILLFLFFIIGKISASGNEHARNPEFLLKTDWGAYQLDKVKLVGKIYDLLSEQSDLINELPTGKKDKIDPGKFLENFQNLYEQMASARVVAPVSQEFWERAKPKEWEQSAAEYFKKFGQFVAELPDRLEGKRPLQIVADKMNKGSLTNFKIKMRGLPPIEEEKPIIDMGPEMAQIEKVRDALSKLEAEWKASVGKWPATPMVMRAIEARLKTMSSQWLYDEQAALFQWVASQRAVYRHRGVAKLVARMHAAGSLLTDSVQLMQRETRDNEKMAQPAVMIGEARAELENCEKRVAEKLEINTEDLGMSALFERTSLNGRILKDYTVFSEEIKQVAELEGITMTNEQIVMVLLANAISLAEIELMEAGKQIVKLTENWAHFETVKIVAESANALEAFRQMLMTNKAKIYV